MFNFLRVALLISRMVQIFLRGLSQTRVLDIELCLPVSSLQNQVCNVEGVPPCSQRLLLGWKDLTAASAAATPLSLEALGLSSDDTVTLLLRGALRGGMDRQNRVAHKHGSGQMTDTLRKQDRKERLRKLAMETIDVSKDPYFMRNHLGTYECKLCLSIHNNEGNYLAHTQGKRHQVNLARRAAKEARDNPAQPQPLGISKVRIRKNIVKIGRPGYKVIKQRDSETKQRSLVFEIAYPEIEEGVQPRHRFMSPYEQRIEPPDKNFQYLLFAASPYETIAFKVPNMEVDKNKDKFLTNWDPNTKTFTLQLYFKNERTQVKQASSGRVKLIAKERDCAY